MSDETAAPESTPAPPPAAAPGTADLLAPGEGPGTSTGATADPASETAPIHGPPSTVDAAPVDLRSPALYVNRALSWLAFNRRGLHEARDPRTPLLERVKFLSIFSSNLDRSEERRVGKECRS